MWNSILEHAARMPAEMWGTLTAMAPYLLFGFLVAGLLSVFISPETVERHLGGRGRLWPALKAAAFGVPLPLCSCGVIPVAASLRRHGAGGGRRRPSSSRRRRPGSTAYLSPTACYRPCSRSCGRWQPS